MIRQRSRLPLFVVLVFLIGVGGSWLRHQGSAVAVKPPAFSSSSDRSVSVPEDFGPIPTVTASDEVHRSATRHESQGAAGSSSPLRSLAARMSRETDGLAVVTHRDGRRSVALGGRFTHMSVAVPGPDGKTEIRCFSNYQEMTGALAGRTAPEAPQQTPHVR